MREQSQKEWEGYCRDMGYNPIPVRKEIVEQFSKEIREGLIQFEKDRKEQINRQNKEILGL
jgi:hypothetical protein